MPKLKYFSKHLILLVGVEGRQYEAYMRKAWQWNQNTILW
jgi:hypothetical protein